MKQVNINIDGTGTPARGPIQTPDIYSHTEKAFAAYRSSLTATVVAAQRAFGSCSGRPHFRRVSSPCAAMPHEQAEALTEAISREVGMPRKRAARIQVGAPIAAWDMYADLAGELEWENRVDHSLVQQVPVGLFRSGPSLTGVS